MDKCVRAFVEDRIGEYATFAQDQTAIIFTSSGSEHFGRRSRPSGDTRGPACGRAQPLAERNNGGQETRILDRPVLPAQVRKSENSAATGIVFSSPVTSGVSLPPMRAPDRRSRPTAEEVRGTEAGTSKNHDFGRVDWRLPLRNRGTDQLLRSKSFLASRDLVRSPAQRE